MKDKRGIVIFLLLLVILCLTGYIIWDKVLDPMINGEIIEECYVNEEEPEEQITEAEEDTSNSSEGIDTEKEKNIMNGISPFIESTYTNASVKATKIRSELKIQYAIEKELMFKKNLVELHNLPEDNRLSLSWNAVKTRINYMFNSNIELVSRLKVAVEGIGCYNAEYYCSNENDCNYTLTPYGCDVGWRFDSYKTKGIKEEKIKNGIELYEKVLHIDCNIGTGTCDVKTFVLDSSKTNGVREEVLGVVDSKTSEEVDKYFDKASTYKYTFGLKNGNYYFISSEIIQ